MLYVAAGLRALSPPELDTLLHVRVLDYANIHDYFDLADGLVSRFSLATLLSQCDRETLAVMRAAADTAAADPQELIDPAAVMTRLVAQSHRPRADWTMPCDVILGTLAELWITVTTAEGIRMPRPAVAVLCELIPTITDLAEARPADLRPVTTVDLPALDAQGAHTAYTTLQHVSDLLAELTAVPARILTRGSLGVPDVRRLAAAMHADPADVPPLLDLAQHTHLVEAIAQTFVVTDQGDAWLRLGLTARWEALAGFLWFDGAPWKRDTTGTLAPRTWTSVADGARWNHPLRTPAFEELLEHTHLLATRIGVLADDQFTSFGDRILDGESAGVEIATHWPTEITHVYLQPDLTVVAPGPLPATTDLRLRGMADREGRDIAATYRFSAQSVTRALQAGETEDTIRAFLEELSHTGVPQPLDFLLRECAGRFGTIRVRSAPEGSIIHSVDEVQLHAMLADLTLAPLALRSVPAGLATNRVPFAVVALLRKLGYPAENEDDHGMIRVGEGADASLTSLPTDPADPVDPLVGALDRLLHATGPVDYQRWLIRQLEAAARDHDTVTATIVLPDGSYAEYLLAPAAVRNGRLRARDQRSDIERTLPISAITDVRRA